MISTKTIMQKVQRDLSDKGYNTNISLKGDFLCIKDNAGFCGVFSLTPYSKVEDARKNIVIQFEDIKKQTSHNQMPEDIILGDVYPCLTNKGKANIFSGSWNSFRVEYHFNSDGSDNAITPLDLAKMKIDKLEFNKIALTNLLQKIKILDTASLLEEYVGKEFSELFMETQSAQQLAGCCYLLVEDVVDFSGVFLIPDIFKKLSKKYQSDILLIPISTNFLMIISVKQLELLGLSRRSKKFKEYLKELVKEVNDFSNTDLPLANTFIYKTRSSAVELLEL